ncbi:MAG: hypothetical protein NVS9B15_03130 [Acidobacteriaceae bacterium]
MRGKGWLLLLLSAVLQTAAYPSPNLYWLGWIAFLPWLITLLRRGSDGGRGRVLRDAGAGWLVGILWYLGTCYWIYISMRLHGGLGPVAAGLVLVLFCIYLGVYHAVFAGLISWLQTRRLNGLWMALAIPCLWVAVELARSRVTSFPWDLLGYTQLDNHGLMLTTAYAGVYGLSFFVMVVNAVLAIGLTNKSGAFAYCGVGLGVVLASCGFLSEVPLPTDHSAVLLQQNLPLESPDNWTRS